ncbi:hypothetical protein H2200_012815 [Cladophialophora chaetospira]|uniref:Major facilitator superfamily (MFS) profile domain-containing protein n=1 Tax=Cladophialophora chaetospira TaxID=386627 RepID=A0AA38WWX4_9EURO|nr:hypothetical protein H2200_012815 [Cladophialophora chaetospira]
MAGTKGTETPISEEKGALQVEHLAHEAVHDAVQTDDAHDPLNWSAPRKLLCLGSMCIWIFIGPANILVNGTALPEISTTFNVPIASTTYLIAGVSLAYGFASLWWVAFANRWGVRFCYVMCAFAAGLLSIWGARANSFASLIISRILASCFFSSPEVLGPQVIGDVFFLKDRAKAVTVLIICQGSGFTLGPLIGAYVYSDLGWRWTQWIIVIMSLISGVILLFFFPETQYTRSTTADKTKRTYRDDLRFWCVSGGGKPKVHSFVSAFIYPFPYLFHPIVLVVIFWFSICLVTANYLLTVMTFSFAQFYGFSVKASGLTYLSPTLGIVVSIFVSGYMADWYEMRNIRIAAKSGKKPAPETRLLLLLIPGSVGVIGTALFGGCLTDKCHWMGPIAGAFGNLFSFVGGLGVAYAYLLDVYEVRTDAVLVMFHSVKNFAGFGITYAVFPWTAASGFTVPFVVLAMALLVAHIPMAALYFIGPGVRKWTAAKFVTGRPSKHGDSF